jgi:hypothetical protein
VSGAITAASVAATGQVSGGTLVAGGATINGTLTAAAISVTNVASAGGFSTTGTLSAATITAGAGGVTTPGVAITGNGSMVTGGPVQAGSLRSNSGMVALEAGSTHYLNWDGANYVLGNGHLFTLAGRVWGTSDFNYIPMNSAVVVVSGVRITEIQDLLVSSTQQVPLGSGQVMISISQGVAPSIFMRIGRLQVLINGVWTNI